MYETLKVQLGERIYYELLGYLKYHGYERVPENVGCGQYVIHGDRVILHVAETTKLVTIDFNEDRVEVIKKQEGGEVDYIEITDNRLITEDGTIEPDSYLVHPHHGVGLYKGRYIRQFASKVRRFLLLEYAQGDTLFFPKDREAELMPYYGSKNPRLSRLYTQSWQRTKKRIADDLFNIAKELIETQAARELVTRKPWSKAKAWQKKVAETFPHTLTTDQEVALSEVLTDLTNDSQPMDRLLTGDVGFGKTEVAIRAAVAVMSGGGQVAVLAPTTVLAEQHYHVFSERLANLPVKVVKVSRNSKLTKDEVEKINSGHYDCIIGTHKLFNKELQYKNLSLLIIDEEQRFGIKHKEHFKEIRHKLDVLSLTATPIPRTLYMGLSGLRDLSLIKTPPGERKGVETKVKPFSYELVKQAIETELDREGQIYYVHNRIGTIAGVVTRLRKALGTKFSSIKYAVAHGRMPSEQLAKVMHQFFSGEIDMLITTAIVEHGLDNPHANTLIVERSENFGLADLYQLRGRVGRRDKQAYAYFLIGDSEQKNPQPLSEDALERLKTIADTEKLGSGWSIALKDLEIRGAGTILGSRQHGNMEAIGLVLYSRMLRRIVKQMKSMSSNDHLTSDILDVWSA